MPILRLLSVLLVSLSLLLLTNHSEPAHADADALPAAAATELAAMNAERDAAGLAPLSTSPVIQTVALTRATTLAPSGVLSHTDPDGDDVATLLMAHGVWFTRVGENLGQHEAVDTEGVTALHTAWMDSPTHRANILDPEFQQVGIGVVHAGGTLVAAIVFLD